MRAFHLPSHHFERQRWKNQLGWTLEITRASALPASAADYAWRASIAEIEQDCAFSSFPGMQRILMLLHGEGMRMTLGDGRHTDLTPPYGRIAFSGDEAAHCSLHAGSTRDFNLIWDPAPIDASLNLRPLVGPMLFFAQPRTSWLIYQCSGQSALKGGLAHMQAGDAMRLDSDDATGGRWILDGNGEIIVCAMRPRPGAAPE